MAEEEKDRTGPWMAVTTRLKAAQKRAADTLGAFKNQMDAAAERDTPVTADEFDAAGALDNDVEADAASGGAMQTALEHLRARHLAFRRASREEERALEELRLQILREVTATPELEDYYREAWDIPGPPVPPSASAAPKYRAIAVMQLELMMRAFFLLRLQLFANAPENHGWMALFRAWGRSDRFNTVFDELRPTLSPEFAAFYRLYLHRLKPLASATGHLPIHHPWLPPGGPVRGRGLYMDSGIVEAEIEVEVRPGAAGVVDDKGPDTADTSVEKPSDAPPTASGSEEKPNA